MSTRSTLLSDWKAAFERYSGLRDSRETPPPPSSTPVATHRRICLPPPLPKKTMVQNQLPAAMELASTFGHSTRLQLSDRKHWRTFRIGSRRHRRICDCTDREFLHDHDLIIARFLFCASFRAKTSILQKNLATCVFRECSAVRASNHLPDFSNHQSSGTWGNSLSSLSRPGRHLWDQLPACKKVAWRDLCSICYDLALGPFGLNENRQKLPSQFELKLGTCRASWKIIPIRMSSLTSNSR